MKNKAKINKEIAKYFGFKECTESKMSPFLYGQKKMPQWIYPNGFYMSQCEVPNFTIPDFITILEDYLKLMKKHGGTGEHEFFDMYE